MITGHDREQGIPTGDRGSGGFVELTPPRDTTILAAAALVVWLLALARRR